MSYEINSKCFEYEKLFYQIIYKTKIIVHHCYDAKVRNDWSIKNRTMDNWLLVYLRNGNGSYITDSKSIKIKKERIILISPNMKHSISIDKNDPPSFVSIHFSFTSINNNKMIKYLHTPFITMIDNNHCINLQSNFKNIRRQIIDKDKEISRLKCHGIMIYILSSLLELYKYKNDKKIINYKVKMVKDMIDEQLNNQQSIEYLAKKVGLSRKYMSECFKKAYGITPKQYQIKVRVSKAYFLLKNSNMSVREVAEYMGYPDQYVLSKQFRKIKGYSPVNLILKR